MSSPANETAPAATPVKEEAKEESKTETTTEETAAPVALPTAAPAQPAPVAAAQAAANAPPSASLYVGELDVTVSEAQLFEIFNMIGPVASIRVCRDAITRRSLGYAYVNYLNSADGERALESLNYSLIKGRACRIMWSQRDPALRKTGQGNIFIKNLDEGIDNKALHDTFAAFGNVLSCKVAVDESGASRGYGFVHYETGEAADKAIEAVNGMLLNDRKVFVGHHVSKKERQSKMDEMKAQFTNIYVKNIDPEVSQEEFLALFEKYGKVTSAVLQVDEETKVSKGFGFVNFEKHEDAKKAVDELNDTEVKGKKLFVARAQKKSEREDELRRSYEASRQEKMNKFAGVNLYIKNIDDEWDDDRLRSEFESFGTITSAKVMRDENQRSRGFGFVCFTAPEEATKAVSEMNGRLSSNGKPLYVSIAQRRDVRRSQLESQISIRASQRMSMVNQMNPMGGYYPAGMPPPGAYPQQRGPPMYAQPGMVRPRYAPVPTGYPQQPMYPGMPPPPPGAPLPAGYRANPVRPRVAGPPNGAPIPAGGPIIPGATSRVPPRPNAQGPRPAPGLTAASLAASSPAEQKQTLGEALYPLIAAINEPLAGKITGMLLEMDVYELLHLIETPDALLAKTNEAMAVLDQWAQESGAAQQQEQPAAAPATEEAVAADATKEEAPAAAAEASA